jgi:hypothetical protein
MVAVWRMYGYQDYPAPELPVFVFKVRSGAQLNDFISILGRGILNISSICLSEAVVHQKNPKTVHIRTYIGQYQLLRKWPK